MDIVDQPVSITDRAREEILDTLSSNKIPDSYGVRVGIRGGSCSGTFVLGFDTMGEHDRVYQVNAIKVFIDKRHLLYVLGTEVDFDAVEGGYTIQKTSSAPGS
ncbi:hypothetical protein GCM10023091_18120 [Ravibacter arvi]|uniref:Core domain-containing protein n=2 Tax=Ravibacter arvi TaxID=2051041 RepID=A0ABP8LVJ6_9BACT